VTLAPPVILGLVGVQVVEDDVDRGIWIGGDDVVHEDEELDAPPALPVCAAVTLLGRLNRSGLIGGSNS
jgi:hypothetical protein